MQAETDDEHAATSARALADLWRGAGLDERALRYVDLPGDEGVLTSSFRVVTAAQASIAASALAAAEVAHRRGLARQRVAVDTLDAARECTGYFSLDGRVPSAWEKYSGLYPCGADTDEPGWVRIHGNFAHHRDAALGVLELAAGDASEKADVERALRRWRAQDFDAAATAAGGVVAAMRTTDAWSAHPQGQASAALPLLEIERIGPAEPRIVRPLRAGAGPLSGLRALELTRILAGPVCGRTLAAHGADVLLVNSPHLPNISAIADTSRGKRSAHVDLDSAAGRSALSDLVRGADVVVQSYRPGSLERRGFGPAEAATLRPGIVYGSLSAYGHAGPWADRRGFDSIVQTASGLNHDEARAFGDERPRPLPVQILDYASGFLLAFGLQVALLRQTEQGGSWHVRVALAATARWLRGLGRHPAVPAPRLALEPHAVRCDSGFGDLRAMPHAARLAATPPRLGASMPPGTHPPLWLDRDTDRR